MSDDRTPSPNALGQSRDALVQIRQRLTIVIVLLAIIAVSLWLR